MIARDLSLRFPKKERLGRWEFEKVFSGGKRLTDGILTVHVLAVSEFQSSLSLRTQGQAYGRDREGVGGYREGGGKKVGFVVRKSVRPLVKKNRIKRLLREIYRKNKHSIKDGLSIIVTAGEKAKGLGFAELETSFLGLLTRGCFIR